MMKLYGLGPTRSLRRALGASGSWMRSFEFVRVNILGRREPSPDFLPPQPGGQASRAGRRRLRPTESAAIVMYLRKSMVTKGLCRRPEGKAQAIDGLCLRLPNSNSRYGG